MNNDNREPKIYVASLAHYNNGELVGKWMNLTDYSSSDELMSSIGAYIASLTCYGEPCEEYAIHDYEYLPFNICEYAGRDTFDKIYSILELSNEYDIDAISAFCNHFGVDSLESFGDAYVGQYDSELDFTYQYVEDCLDLEKTMGNLSIYFDFKRFSLDLFSNSYEFLDGYVFNSCF